MGVALRVMSAPFFSRLMRWLCKTYLTIYIQGGCRLLATNSVSSQQLHRCCIGQNVSCVVEFRDVRLLHVDSCIELYWTLHRHCKSAESLTNKQTKNNHISAENDGFENEVTKAMIMLILNAFKREECG